MKATTATSRPLELMDEMGASKYLQTKVKTLRNWRHTGAGPRFRKLGVLVRYDRADLDSFASRHVGGGDGVSAE